MKGYAMGILAGLMLLSGCVFLDGPDAHDGPPGRGRRGEPPPEAYAACKDKSEGDKVEITTPWGDKMTATCKLMDGKLVALPEGGPQDHGKPSPGRVQDR